MQSCLQIPSSLLYMTIDNSVPLKHFFDSVSCHQFVTLKTIFAGVDFSRFSAGRPFFCLVSSFCFATTYLTLLCTVSIFGTLFYIRCHALK